MVHRPTSVPTALCSGGKARSLTNWPCCRAVQPVQGAAFHGEPVVYARPFLPRVFSCGTSFECAKRAVPQCWYDQWVVAVDKTAGSDLNSKRCDFCFKLVLRVHR